VINLAVFSHFVKADGRENIGNNGNDQANNNNGCEDG
jgi:hypothetical protein